MIIYNGRHTHKTRICHPGTVYVAKWMYQDIFAGADPVKIHREYIGQFQGMELPDKVYVHP